MLKVKKLTKVYGDKTVLNIGNLEIKKGQTVVIVGPNGSGKSTLLRIVSGVLSPTGGETETEGTVCYLPQQSVPFSKTVRKNFLCVSDDKRRCQELLEELSLDLLADKDAKTLSGGECQRLALGRVLMNKCDFLLLDEPSSAADIESTEIIEEAIIKYKAETGCGILMTTHSPRQAKELADRIIMLNSGEIVEDGHPDSLLDNPTTPWGKKFIDSWRLR